MIQIQIDQEVYSESTSYKLVSCTFFADKEVIEEKVIDLTFNHPVFNKIGSTNYIRMSSLFNWLRLLDSDVITINNSSAVESNIQSLMYVMKTLVIFNGLWIDVFCSGCGKKYKHDDLSAYEVRISAGVILLLSCPENHVLSCKQTIQFD